MIPWRSGVLVVAVVAAAGRPAGSGVSAQQLDALPKKDKGCVISSTPVSFGNYNVLSSSPLTALGIITYTCGPQARSAIKQVTIELSRSHSGTFDRAMQGGSERLRYNLYLDAQATRVWGDGSQGTVVYTAQPKNNQTYTVNIFGRVFEMQDVSAGFYEDNITATILF